MPFEFPTIISHVGSATRLPVNIRLFVAALAGLGAAALTAISVEWLDEGETTLAFLVAATVGSTPEEITPRSRSLFLYTLGLLLGMLFEGIIIGYEAIRPVIVRFVGIVSLSDIVAAVVVTLLMYATVAYLVFPRYRGTDAPPLEVLRRTWLALSVTYGVALLVLVPVAYLVVPVA